MDNPQLESVTQICDGWVKKYVLTYRMPDGAAHEYEVASRKGPEAFREHLQANGAGTPPVHADAVCIVAETPRKSLVMIREFRYPLNSWCIAFPAGLVDPGESIAECADRELREETGYGVIAGTSVRALPQAGYSSTGLTDETVQVVYVRAEQQGAPRTERNELIEVFELPIADVPRFLDENRLPIGTRAQLILEAFRREALQPHRSEQ